MSSHRLANAVVLHETSGGTSSTSILPLPMAQRSQPALKWSVLPPPLRRAFSLQKSTAGRVGPSLQNATRERPSHPRMESSLACNSWMQASYFTRLQLCNQLQGICFCYLPTTVANIHPNDPKLWMMECQPFCVHLKPQPNSRTKAPSGSMICVESSAVNNVPASFCCKWCT